MRMVAFVLMMKSRFTSSFSSGIIRYPSNYYKHHPSHSNRIRCFCMSMTNNMNIHQGSGSSTFQERKKQRREHVGRPKAQDRGQFSNIYSVEHNLAKSGLPDDYRTELFTVLGIESSCDDTGAAVVRSDGVILGEALASQSDIHEVS